MQSEKRGKSAVHKFFFFSFSTIFNCFTNKSQSLDNINYLKVACDIRMLGFVTESKLLFLAFESMSALNK